MKNYILATILCVVLCLLFNESFACSVFHPDSTYTSGSKGGSDEKNDLRQADSSSGTYSSDFMQADITCNEADESEEILSRSKTSRRNLYARLTNPLMSKRFRARGYDNNETELYLAGLLMNDLQTGKPTFSGGLATTFTHTEPVTGLQSGELGAGALQGYIHLDAAAAHQAPQSTITYSQSNRFYRNNILACYQTGLMRNGWAFSTSMNQGWSQHGYRDGVFVSDKGWYLALSRKFSDKSMLHFLNSGNCNEMGLMMPATMEAYELSNSHSYNPAWGYQQGVQRNTNTVKGFHAIYALQYEYKNSHQSCFELTALYQSGYNEQSGLDWYRAADPRPDYYKRMPSYYRNDPAIANEFYAAAISEQWRNDALVRQVNWSSLYEVNRMNIDQVNGWVGKRSAYIMGADRSDNRRYGLAATFRKMPAKGVRLAGGINMILQQEHCYRKMLDLLGGDYYVDINQYAEQNYTGDLNLKQTDLNHTDRIIQVGDSYGYNYQLHLLRLFAWMQCRINFNKFDFSLAGRLVLDQYRRRGLFKTGLFPNTAQGNSPAIQFFTKQLKGGVTWKISQVHQVYVNATYLSRPPLVEDVFISPGKRNDIARNPCNEQAFSWEAGYGIYTQSLTGQATFWLTDFNHRVSMNRFYHDGEHAFVNYLMEGIDLRYHGAELALQYKISTAVQAGISATWMQAFYRSNPRVTIYPEDDTGASMKRETVWLKNYVLPAGPQSAYTLNVQYRTKSRLQLGLGVNILDRNYIAVNPLRHTERAVELELPGSERYNGILRQERLPSFFTVDLFVAKMIKLNKIFKKTLNETSIEFSAGVGNLFNRKDIILSGADQFRFDFETGNPAVFPAKYTFGQGINYFVKCKISW